MADLNGDGRTDLISGSNCCDPYGFHVFFRKPDGTFGPGKRFEAAFADSKGNNEKHLAVLMRGHSRMLVTDWNRDGKPDLLLTWLGSQRLFVALGPFDITREEIGGFKQVPLDTPGPFGSAPVVVDWDRDDNPDLLVVVRGDAAKRIEGGVYWYRNLADKREPQFAPGVRLVPGGSVTNGKLVEILGIAATDWDADGWPDLLVSWFTRERAGSAAGVWHDTSRVELYRRDVPKR